MRATRVAILVPLVLFACDREPAAPEVDLPPEFAPEFAATSEWYEDEFVLPEGDFFFYAPCVDDWFDEIGTVVRRRHRVIKDDGVALIKWQIRAGDDYVARGDMTGDWYAISGWNSQIITTSNPAYHYSWNLHWVVKNATTGTVLDWPIRVTVVENANGEVTVDHYAEPCKVRHE